MVLGSCDQYRIFEMNHPFDDRTWKVTEEPRFEFVIRDTLPTYHLYYNVRNTMDYPYARIFVMAHLYDSTQRELSRKMLNDDLFDQKTGRPLGASGIGDLYDHRFIIWRDQRFKYAGKYSIKLDQFMRLDTLKGLVAVGVRVERTDKQD